MQLVYALQGVVKSDDAAVAGISLYVVDHVLGGEPSGIVTCDKIPHHDVVLMAQPPINAPSHPSMWRTKEVAVDNLLRHVYVDEVSGCPMLEGVEVVESVVAHLVPLGYDLIVEIMVAEYILANHEEGGLYVISPQRIEDKRCRFGNGPVIEREVNRTLVGVHSPYRPWI